MLLENSYWNSNGKYESEYHHLSSDLIPYSGSCSTIEGELLRAISKIYYDGYNNGFCNNTSGPFNFLLEKLDYRLSKCFYNSLRGVVNTGGYSNLTQEMAICLEETVNYVIEHILSLNGNYTTNNEDMFDYEDSTDWYKNIQDDNEYEDAE